MSGGGQPIDTNCMTLTRYILAEQRKYPSSVGNLTQLLSSLQSAIKAISAAVRRAGISNLFGAAGNIEFVFSDVPGFQKSGFGFWKWPFSNGLNTS